jgi:predicted secreted protein
MKTQKELTPQEFQLGLQGFVGKEITKFYYITDSIVVLKAGKEVLRPFEEKPIYDSEYELWIDGGWKYVIDDTVVETSMVSGEELPILRKRIGDFIESIHPNTVTSVTISDDGQTAQVSLDLGGKFIIRKDGDSFISFSHQIYNDNGEFVRAEHFRPEEDTGKLTMSQVVV